MNEAAIDSLIQMLERSTTLDHLDALMVATQPNELAATVKRDLRSVALSFDTAGLINIAKHPRASDMLDYVGAEHEGPVVVSAQSLLEYWNNGISAFEGIAEILSKKFLELDGLVANISSSYPSLASRLRPLLEEFAYEYGHVLDERKSAQIGSVVKTLASRARTAEAPRELLAPIAAHRKLTKTPPGFKDEGNGDFFVWCDTLLALLELQISGQIFPAVVLVTDDTKKDWSTGGTTHPTLYAECVGLLGVPVQCWSVKQFAAAVESRTGMASSD